MKAAVIIAALASAVVAAPQAVTSAIAPTASSPAGCSKSYNGEFQLVVEAISSSSKSKRDSTPLEVTLANGVLTDAKKRTGYIASNYQFQFDGPPQAGAIYTAGWSICSNGSLALGGSAVFYQCLSGEFYNLYDRSWAAQCSPIYLVALGGTAVTAASASEATDGQVAAATTESVLCQIGDGQIQKNTCMTTVTAVQQQSDGQITAAKATITQISDGQIQAPATTAAVTTSAASVKSTSTPVGATVGVQTDGQITAGTSKAAATNGTVAASTQTPTTTAAKTTTPASSTGGATDFGVNSLFALAAGALAILAL